MRIRDSVVGGGHFWKWLAKNYSDDYFHEDQLLVDKFMNEVWEKEKYNGEWMAECMERVQLFYLRTDNNTWR